MAAKKQNSYFEEYETQDDFGFDYEPESHEDWEALEDEREAVQEFFL